MPSKKKSANQTLDVDDVLSEMLLEVPVSRVPVSTQKPTKKIKTLEIEENINVKRPRLCSPEPEEEQLEVRPQSPAEEFDQDPGIQAIPLSEDLKSNLEFYEDDKYTRFYWYECCEDQAKSPGVVYFFGRIYAVTAKRYVSCCTIVKNVRRTCYLLITHDSTYDQAVDEFTHIIAKRFKIKNFTCDKVRKKYAFSPDPKVPLDADYVKVEYPANQAALPADLRGETFSHVFNVSQSPMEKLILDLKLRGPCWMRLMNPVVPNGQLTWSRIELILESPQNLLVEENSAALKVPYFCTFSLSLRIYPNPITNLNEIVAIAGMVNTTFELDQCLKRTNKASGHFCLMTKPPHYHKDLKLPYDFNMQQKKYNKTKFELFDNERDLLIAFMDKFSNLDPDIVVGHDLVNFDYETLVMRMKIMKVGAWSKLGRFKRTEIPQSKTAFKYMFSGGRILCDIKTSAMELIKARSYDLTELTSQVLSKSRIEYNYQNIVEAYKTSDSLFKMIHATWEDNDNIFSILVELNVIPLALKITNITGNILSRTLSMGRSERNEYLLLHAFHEDNFICPEKRVYSKFGKTNNKTKDEPLELAPTRRKAAYTGGLVLEPKSGYYDSCVLLMDFNSLYPSIIQEFNICFSTVKVPDTAGVDANAEIIASVPDESMSSGILPAQLKNLVDGRRRVKRLLADAKTPEQKLMLDIEQKALKLTANSMYGCLGFEYSRFYAKHLASLVTFKGREILMSTKAMVEKLGYDVIYGDTDSLMINTKIIDYDDVIQRGNEIKGEINRTFKLLEIDIDGVYRPLLLLKKKNYAGTMIKKLSDGKFANVIETKGLDTVRRDRAVIAKEAGEKVLAMILTAEKEIDLIVEDIHNYLKNLADSIKSDEIPASKFLISKQLNRNPEEYRDTKGLGHITLALRHNSDPKKTRKLKSGDTVEYVICLNDTTESANQRAYTLEELNLDPKLKLDYEYYLCQQIHPVMSRICDKLPVTNAYVLAEMLGIEKSSMLHIKRDESEGVRRDQLLSKGEARFNSCKPLEIYCPNCNLPTEINSRVCKNKEKKTVLSLTNCNQCGIRYAMRAKLVIVQIVNIIKKLTNELFNTKFVCENPECDYQTHNLFCRLTTETESTSSSPSSKPQPICDLCESPMSAEMDDRKMDLQLSYMKHLFDVRRAQDKDDLDELRDDLLEMYQDCYKEIDYALRNSFINNIDTFAMFSMICSGSSNK